MRTIRFGRSVWLDREKQRVRQTYPSLRCNLDVDVAVVGGGMTGAAVAAAFTEAGAQVAVLEAALVGLGSTAASTALLLREPDMSLTDLGRRYGTNTARRICQLSAQASRDCIDTIRRHHVACDLTEQDTIYFTIARQTVRALRADYEKRRRGGFASEWLTSRSLRQTGIAGEAAIRTRGNAQFNPFAGCRGLMRAAARAGSAVFERSAVRDIQRKGDGVLITTRSGSVRAAQVVIATGYAAPSFQPAVGRFRLNYTYVLATKRISRQARSRLELQKAMFWDTEHPYHYARWTSDQRLLLGGADRPVELKSGRAAVFRRGTRELRRYFFELLSPLSDIGIDFAWDGVFATTPDGLPYIGAHSRYPRRLFALGYGGNGMTFGFLAARMLVEQWRGIESPDHALFGFGRFL